MLLPLLACTPPPAQATLSPASGPSSGYFPVEITLDEEVAVTAVTVGGVATYALAQEGARVRVTVQGSPVPGPSDVVLSTAGGDVVLPGVFTWDAPADPVFDRLVMVGASLGQGIQSGVPSDHGTYMGPGAQLARQAGAYFPLPMLVPDLFPVMGPADIGPPPDCAVPDVVEFVSDGAQDVMLHLIDEETHQFGFQYARVDPDIAVQALAVGGSNVADVLDGPTIDNFTVTFMSHMVLDPYGEIGDTLPHPQVEMAEALSPTMIVSTDLYGNDVIGALLLSDVIDPSLVTPMDTFDADLDALLARLAATGAEVFVADLPRPTLLPATEEKRARMLREGTATEEEVDAAIASVDAMAAAMDALLADKAAAYPNVHVVPLHAECERIAAEGYVIGGETLHIGKFEGLLSLDGVHFSDTGYAMLASLFVRTVNTELGLDVPEVDLAAVLASDPYGPTMLRAGGLDPDACE